MISPLRGGDIPPCGRYEGTLRSFKKLSGRFLQWIQLCRFGKAVWKKAVKPSGTIFKSKAGSLPSLDPQGQTSLARRANITSSLARRANITFNMYPRREPEAGENPGVMGSAAAVVVAAAAPAASAAVAAASALAIAPVAHHLEDDRAHEHGERAADDPCRHCVYLPKRPYAPTLTFWVRRLSS